MAIVRKEERSSLYASVFNTEQGKKALEDLRGRFATHSCFTDDPRTTCFKLGQEAVLRYIDKNLK